jgi:hypothetical protein
VQWRGRLLQIDKQHEALNLPGKSVTLRDRLGAELHLLWQEQTLAWQAVSERPKRPKAKPVIVNNKVWKPPADHPWNRGRPGPGKNNALPAPHGGPAEHPQRTVLLR